MLTNRKRASVAADTSMNLGSLPRNKTLFYSVLLIKFSFLAQKCVPIIRVLSLEMEGTILKKEFRQMCWDPKLEVKVVAADMSMNLGLLSQNKALFW